MSKCNHLHVHRTSWFLPDADTWVCDTCGQNFYPSKTFEELKETAKKFSAMNHWRTLEEERLRKQIASLEQFVDFCTSLTGSLWPQNETTEALSLELSKLYSCE